MSSNIFLIQNISREFYNNHIEELARDFRLSAGSYKVRNDSIFETVKQRVSTLPDFVKFFKCCKAGENLAITSVLCCLIAGFYVVQQQDQIAHSDYIGNGSQTFSFSLDLGVVMDRNNEWVRLAYSLMGRNNPSRIKVRAIGL